MDSHKAERCGLVSDVYTNQSDMDEAALELAMDMLSNSDLGLRYTKEVLSLNIDASSLEAALMAEDRTQNMLSIANKDDIEARMKAVLTRPKTIVCDACWGKGE